MKINFFSWGDQGRKTVGEHSYRSYHLTLLPMVQIGLVIWDKDDPVPGREFHLTFAWLFWGVTIRIDWEAK